ncbi:MAG: hypothetical protein ACLR7U_14890 [Ruthenibacterium lactatiformans]
MPACNGRWAAVKRLAQNPATAPCPACGGVALLYGTRQVVFIDTQKNPVTGRYLLHTRSSDNLFTE